MTNEQNKEAHIEIDRVRLNATGFVTKNLKSNFAKIRTISTEHAQRDYGEVDYDVLMDELNEGVRQLSVRNPDLNGQVISAALGFNQSANFKIKEESQSRRKPSPLNLALEYTI